MYYKLVTKWVLFSLGFIGSTMDTSKTQNFASKSSVRKEEGF